MNIQYAWEYLKKIPIIMIAVACLLLPSSGNICRAAVSEEVTRHFVDESNHVGYYVDISTVKFDSWHTFTAEVSMVRPKEKELYVYLTRFDTEKTSYQYLSFKKYSYEGKTLLSEHNTPNTEQDYMRVPAIKSIVNFIFEWYRFYPNDFNIPPVPPPPPPAPVVPPAPAVAANPPQT